MLNTKDNSPEFFTEIIDSVYKNLRLSTFAVVVNMIVLYIVCVDTIDKTFLNSWLVGGLVITFARLYLSYEYNRNKNRWTLERWRQIFLIGVILGALIWAVLPFFIFDSDNVLHHAMLMFIIAGLTAGSISSLSAYHLAIKLFLVVTLIPFIVKLLMLEAVIYHYLALLVFCIW